MSRFCGWGKVALSQSKINTCRFSGEYSVLAPRCVPSVWPYPVSGRSCISSGSSSSSWLTCLLCLWFGRYRLACGLCLPPRPFSRIWCASELVVCDAVEVEALDALDDPSDCGTRPRPLETLPPITLTVNGLPARALSKKRCIRAPVPAISPCLRRKSLHQRARHNGARTNLRTVPLGDTPIHYRQHRPFQSPALCIHPPPARSEEEYPPHCKLLSTLTDPSHPQRPNFAFLNFLHDLRDQALRFFSGLISERRDEENKAAKGYEQRNGRQARFAAESGHGA